MKKILTTSFIFFFMTLFIPESVAAATFEYATSLVTLPGGIDSPRGFEGFVNLLYGLSISIAALLAVVKIVIAGVKWMLSDVVTSKTEAKKDIQNALFGLILIIGAVLIITIINPDIVNPD